MSLSPHLIRAVRESRIDIAREYSGLLSDLDVRKKFRNSFRNHPLRWVGGAAVAGILTSLFGSRESQKTIKPPASTVPQSAAGEKATLSKAGWWAGALEVVKLLYPVLRPLLLEFASNAVQSGFAKKNR